MHLTRLLKLALIFAFCSLLSAPLVTRAENPPEEAAKYLPDRLGDYRAVSAAQSVTDNKIASDSRTKAFDAVSGASRIYRSGKGEKFSLIAIRMRSEASAYAFLTSATQPVNGVELAAQAIVRTGEVGTASIVLPNSVFFCKGATFISISPVAKPKTPASSNEELLAFARSVADTLDAGDGEIPVLVKHLPDWESVYGTAAYAVSHEGLKAITEQRPVLDAVSFEGGAEAVTATYGSSRLVMIEHTTPQLATNDDARINAKINELKSGGQAVPSAYRRVGNYAVFVFDAPDEATAAQLIDKINYEQVVQWLGNNPHWMERAEREYRQTTAGVILSVIKGTGLSLLICLGIGGIFGSIIFKHRRAQAAVTEAYSDAGGMLRLNLDEMTPHVDASRLLGKGDS